MDHLQSETDPLQAVLHRWAKSLSAEGFSEERVADGFLGRTTTYLGALVGDLSIEAVARVDHRQIELEFTRHPLRLENAEIWRVLRKFFEFAVADGALSYIPFKRVRHPGCLDHPMRGGSSLETFLSLWLDDLMRKGLTARSLADHKRTALTLMMGAMVPLQAQGLAQLNVAHVQDHFVQFKRRTRKNYREQWKLIWSMFEFAVLQRLAPNNPLTGTWPDFEVRFSDSAAAAPIERSPEGIIVDYGYVQDLEKAMQERPDPDWLKAQNLALVSLFYVHRFLPVEVYGLSVDQMGNFSIHRTGRRTRSVSFDAETLSRITRYLALHVKDGDSEGPIFRGVMGGQLDNALLTARWKKLSVGGLKPTPRLLRGAGLLKLQSDGKSIDEIHEASRTKFIRHAVDDHDMDFAALHSRFQSLHPRYDA